MGHEGHPAPAGPIDGPVAPVERLLAPVHRFMSQGASGGIVLLVSALAAMAWANSPWRESYEHLRHLKVTVGAGELALTMSVEHWINDALMSMFFFLVGLEIKREVLIGELSSPRKAAVPVVAALGGMVVPGAIFAAINWGQPTIRGWGVPMATDIAFALGVLAILGRRLPPTLRVFLATLAIADDLGALVVIALFYTDNLALWNLGAAGVLVGLMAVLNAIGVRRTWPFATVGLLVWLFVLGSGVHATISGVAAAMTIPVRTRVDAAGFIAAARDGLRRFELAGPAVGRLTPDQRHEVERLEQACERASSPLMVLEHAMTPWVAFVVVPIFGLANAGVPLGSDLAGAIASRESMGIALGLVIGKPVGITVASWLAVRSGLGVLPTGVSWRQLHGAAWLGGIGFTMSLFIAQLAFPDAATLDHAKLGIIAGSVVAGSVGGLLLAGSAGGRRGGGSSDQKEPGPCRGTG